MTRRTLYVIGNITKVFGIRGEVIIRPTTPSVKRFAKLKQVFVGTTEENAREMSILSVALQERGVRMGFDEVQSRTQAERLVGATVFVEEKDRIRLPRGTYFVHDIVGLVAVDQSGREVGTVQEILHMPANDVYVIRGNGCEIMLPAVKEFVKEYDLEKRVIRVHLIEGMVNED